jgi:hypothetical protein
VPFVGAHIPRVGRLVGADELLPSRHMVSASAKAENPSRKGEETD